MNSVPGTGFPVTESFESNGKVLGANNGEYTTDENGRIVIEGLEPGVTIIAKEIRGLDGYVLDTSPKTIQIKVGDAQTLKFAVGSAASAGVSAWIGRTASGSAAAHGIGAIFHNNGLGCAVENVTAGDFGFHNHDGTAGWGRSDLEVL